MASCAINSEKIGGNVKYTLQVIITICLPFSMFILSQNMAGGKIGITDVNVVLKHVELVFFVVAGVVGIFGYVYLVGMEIGRGNKTSHTMAQCICFLVSINSFCYFFIVREWIKIITEPNVSQTRIATIDIFFSLVDISSAFNKLLFMQFIFVVIYQRWILPFSPRLRIVPPLGRILVDDMKIISEDQLKEALKKQHESGKE